MPDRSDRSGRSNAHSVLVHRSLDREEHVALHQGEQRVVLAHADVGAGVELGAALAHDDGTGADEFTAESLHAEHLGLGIPPVSRRAAAFFLCHFNRSSLARNRADLQFGELLAMALALLIVLATAHLEDANLVVLAVSHHSGYHGCAGHQGCANLEFSA